MHGRETGCSRSENVWEGRGLVDGGLEPLCTRIRRALKCSERLCTRMDCSISSRLIDRRSPETADSRDRVSLNISPRLRNYRSSDAVSLGKCQARSTRLTCVNVRLDRVTKNLETENRLAGITKCVFFAHRRVFMNIVFLHKLVGSDAHAVGRNKSVAQF